MPEFWRASGYYLLDKDAAGRLQVTDDFLRAYFLRPEIHPVEESCAAECALHAALMSDPRRLVQPADIDAFADADARDNYRVMLNFRDRLLAADSLEACYAGLFRGDRVDVAPLFIDQLAHVVVRNVLERFDDPLAARAAELFFREQKFSLQDGQPLLADLETIEMHASGNRYGSIGRLIVEAQGGLAASELDVLRRDNAALYWTREARFDTVIPIGYGSDALEAFARVLQAWIAHFHGISVTITPVRSIDGPRWRWHLGLDAESTAILNDLWEGREVEAGRMRRLLALFTLEFDDPSMLRADLAGERIVLGLAADAGDVVRMKPQNLLLNLPLAIAG